MKRKQLQALLSRPRQHCDVSNAVKVVKSAVDVRVKPGKKKISVFKKRCLKNKKKNKE